MRGELISRLNRTLDTDHNLVEEMLLKPNHVCDKGIFNGKVTALWMLCDMMDIERIYPVYENEIIQYFE